MTVLYIDDDIEDIELFEEALHHVDPDIEFHSSLHVDEALYKLFNHSLIPDAIFVDLHLPKSDGLECVKRMKEHEHLTTIPIVILSTTIGNRQVDDFNKLGVYYFLSKSALISKMEPALKVIIDSLCKGESRFK
jgi:CheY-like chemotaxis protein